MKTKVFSFIFVGVFFCLVDGICNSSTGLETQVSSFESNETLGDILLQFTTSEGEKEKVDAINRIGKLNTPQSEKILKQYLRTFYNSDESISRLKVATIRALLSTVDDFDGKRIIFELFRAEIEKLEKSKSSYTLRENDALNVLTSKLDCGEIPDDIYRKVSTLSMDPRVSEEVRVLFTKLIVKKATEDDKRDDLLKIEAILEKIPLRVYVVIPWNIYNVKAKRMAFDTSEQRRNVSHFFSSRNGYILYEAYFSELLRYKLKSLEQLVNTLESKKYQKERSDFLAEVGVKLLVTMISDDTSDLEKQRLTVLLHRLEKHVENMEDNGAGCYRNNAICTLSAYYSRKGIKNHPVFKEGGNVFATIGRFGEDDASLTNEVSIIESKNISNKSDSHPKMWIYVILITVFLAIAMLACICRLRNKRKSF